MSAAEVLSRLCDIGKIPSKVLCVLCIVSGVLLFAPGSLHETLRTTRLVDKFGLFVGLTFIGSGTLLTVNVVMRTWVGGARIRAKRRWRRNLGQTLAELDPVEKAILREFVLQGKRCVMLPIDEPTVAGLLNRRILVQVGTIGRQSLAGSLFPVQMHAAVSEVLVPEHLDLYAGEPTEADKKRVISQRPRFVQEVMRVEGRREGW